MQDRNFDPMNAPLVTQFGQTNIAGEMIGQDDKIKQLFLTLTYFTSMQEAMDYSDILYKCKKHKMWSQMERWLLRIHAKVAVKGFRAGQIVDILTMLQRDIQDSRREKIDAATNKGIKNA